jgi:hypothetical protein
MDIEESIKILTEATASRDPAIEKLLSQYAVVIQSICKQLSTPPPPPSTPSTTQAPQTIVSLVNK